MRAKPPWESGRFRGFSAWLLHYLTGFGLALSVAGGFLLGYFLGGAQYGIYVGLGGALAGFILNFLYLLWLSERK
jgi:hypothetical protein